MSVPDAEYQKALVKIGEVLGHVVGLVDEVASVTAERDGLKSQLAAVLLERDGHGGYAETVRHLHEEIERLREALAPFAEAAQYMITGKVIDPEEAGIWTDNRSGCRVTVADFRAAEALTPLAGTEGGAG